MAATGATGFRIDLRTTGETPGPWTTLAENEPGPNATLDIAEGEYEARVAGRNAAGLGEWSGSVTFSVGAG